MRAGMPETSYSDSNLPHSLFHFLKTNASISLQTISKAPIFFISITALTILPLSILLFTLAFLSRPLQHQISYKTYIAQVGPIPVEARHVYDEIRSDALSLLRLKAVYFLPSYALSLLAAITAVSSTSLSYHGKRPSRLTALTALRTTWPRFVVTSVFVFVLTSGYRFLARGVLGWGCLARVRWAAWGVGAVLEMYLEEVLSIGMVVSVLEERSGLEALYVGWVLMESRRFCGMVLGGLVVLGSGVIGWGLRALMDDGKMDGGDLVGLIERGALIGLFCWVVLWSFVSNTVLYCECRKYHGIRTGGSSVELVTDTL